MSFAHYQYPVAELTTLGLAGSVACYAEARNERDLGEALQLARSEHLAILPVGGGSNLVLEDGLQRLLLRFGKCGYRVLEETDASITLRVAAGTHWHNFVDECLQRGWYGLENLALIPGTVGAAPIQNIGAYGVEISEYIEAVHGIYLPEDANSAKLQYWRLDQPECGFGYRDSVFKRSLKDRVLITDVDLKLRKQFTPCLDYPALAERLPGAASARDVFDAVVAVRKSKLPDPDELPNAGSFFKNPVIARTRYTELLQDWPAMPCFEIDSNSQSLVKVPAGWLIEQAGFKGKRYQANKSLGMHQHQALVLVNYGESGQVQASELLAFADQLRAAIEQEFGIALEIEPSIYRAA